MTFDAHGGRQVFQDSRVLLRKEASESNFKNAAALFPRIHLATHGEFLPDAPLESRLNLD